MTELLPRAGLFVTAIGLALMVGCGGDKSKSPNKADSKSAQAKLTVPTNPARLPDGPPGASDPPAGQQEPPTEPERTFRRDDDRVVPNQQRLNGSGIRRYESNRLILYTDIAPAIAEKLPALADDLYAELVTYFGELPPNRAGSDFQTTGYLMADQAAFRSLALLTDRVPPFEHGRHVGYEFWLNDQKDDYYRRHLMLHEFVHCFMACVTGTVNAPPAWYMEGMAEYFATHRLTSEGVRFGIMPENKTNYPGLGRITFLNRARDLGRVRTLGQVSVLEAADSELYPWSWSACWFLANHPQTAEGFRRIGTHLTRAEFLTRMSPILTTDEGELSAEWAWFQQQLCDGYDIKRGATRFAAGRPLAEGESITVEIVAAAGWQSAGVVLDASANYLVQASGRFQVDNSPGPWISEPDGVSVEYVGEHRLGCLMAAVWDSDRPETLSTELAIGSASEIRGRAGTLCLRVNDAMHSLHNNDGQVHVTITRVR